MPDRVPCEGCPFVRRQKRKPGHGQPPEEVHRVANGGWRACDEDGGTCWGAVAFTKSDEALTYQQPPEADRPAVARQQQPETPADRPTITKPGTALDFITTDKDA